MLEYSNNDYDPFVCSWRADARALNGARPLWSRSVRYVGFDRQPTLVGERFELRPLREDDFAALYAHASDPLTWEQHPDSERYREDVFRVYFDGHLASGGALAFVDRATGEPVGVSRYENLDEQAGEVEIGWTFLARPYWGGAANGEIKALMLDHAFRFVDTVVFRIDPENWRSRKSVEKLGARLRPERRDGYVVYAISGRGARA
jgi:RimJ/RimL family protein N-acetyltransferase